MRVKAQIAMLCVIGAYAAFAGPSLSFPQVVLFSVIIVAGLGFHKPAPTTDFRKEIDDLRATIGIKQATRR